MSKASQFLKFVDDGGKLLVEGECFDEKHLKEIDVTGWSWDVEDPAVPKQSPKSDGDGVGTVVKKPDEGESDGKPKPSRFSFSKTTDRSTTRLLSAMDSGEVFPMAVLTLEERYEESPLPFEMHIEMTDVFLTDFKWRANAERTGMQLGEDWELNYSHIHFKYHWRAGDRGWIDQQFDRPPDEKGGSSKKSPLTPAENQAKFDDAFNEALKKVTKK